MKYTGLSPYFKHCMRSATALKIAGLLSLASVTVCQSASAMSIAEITADAERYEPAVELVHNSLDLPTTLEMAESVSALSLTGIPNKGSAAAAIHAIAVLETVELNSAEREQLRLAELLPELEAELVNPTAAEKPHQIAAILLIAQPESKSESEADQPQVNNEQVAVLISSQGRRYQQLNTPTLGSTDSGTALLALPIAKILGLPITSLLMDLDTNFADRNGGAHILLHSNNRLKLGLGMQVELVAGEGVPAYYYSGMLKYRFKK